MREFPGKTGNIPSIKRTRKKNKVTTIDVSPNLRLAIIGLGYVGLPLAIEFGKKFNTIGFDINTKRIEALQKQVDTTLEVEPEEFRESKHIRFTTDENELDEADVFIVTVPTPITQDKRPDLTAMLKASELVGRHIKQGATVIYESTVYPGATEEDCIPVVEKISGKKANLDFFYGYSPERINPGDKQHRLPTIKKVTSGSTPETGQFVDQLYASIITAGTHLASSVRVAEAAKVIENTQRDINIGLVNELAVIFNKMGIDTEEVLQAAGTKWNFLPFRPGLVGGHCIGVDPYYLTYKSEQLGHRPEIILSGRRLNDAMGAYVVSTLVKYMIRRGIQVHESRVLVMGLAFKENCPDIRNTRVVDIVAEMKEYTPHVDVYDPQVSAEDASHEYGITLQQKLEQGGYDAIILAVAHREFSAMGGAEIRKLGKQDCVLYDLKYLLPQQESDLRL